MERQKSAFLTVLELIPGEVPLRTLFSLRRHSIRREKELMR